MEDLRTLIDAFGDWSARLLPDPERARQLQDNLGEMAQSRDLQLSMPLSGPLLALVAETCHHTARHLTIELHDSPSPPDQDAPGWPPVQGRRSHRAGYVRSVLRSGRHGELRLDGFDDAEHASPYLQAAFTLLRECNALI